MANRLLIALSSYAVAITCCGARNANAHELPNIIIIYADDLGYGDLSCYNPKAAYKTPRLDKLAAEGIRFVDAHSPSTICSPSRYGLYSGQLVCRTGRRSTAFEGPSGPSYLAPGRLTIAEMLQKQGYRTGVFGKWHVGLTWYDKAGKRLGGGFKNSLLIDYEKSTPLEDGPNKRGFDESFVTPNCPTTDPLYLTFTMVKFQFPPASGIGEVTCPIPAASGAGTTTRVGWHQVTALSMRICFSTTRRWRSLKSNENNSATGHSSPSSRRRSHTLPCCRPPSSMGERKQGLAVTSSTSSMC